ncbi:LacI family DNA-binding transcriptional regulator [Nocardioides dilutus]
MATDHGADRSAGLPTMQHVAALAEVSLKTVSRVVNGEGGVSPQLVERVQDAVARLGYRHNLGASNLRRGRRTASIGVLVQDLSNDFCGELLRAVEARARQQGVVVISASLDDEPERERELVAGLVSRRCDGLILMPAGGDQSYLVSELRAGLRVVVVDRSPTNVAVDSVTVDNRAGAAEACRHLREHGHVRVAALVDDLSIETARERLAGYREAMGADRDTELEAPGLRTQLDAQRVVTSMLASADPPTALFCGRNEITIGAVRALQSSGLERQVAVVGFDDFATADLLRPGLTAVRQDAAHEGELAFDILMDRLDGGTEPIRRELLRPELVCRGSGEIPGPDSLTSARST